MPAGNGWWLDVRTGAEERVFEHQARESRIKAGWIRVREWKSDRVFEASRLTESALCTILEFMQRHHWWDSDIIRLHDIKEVSGRVLTVGKLKAELGL